MKPSRKLLTQIYEHTIFSSNVESDLLLDTVLVEAVRRQNDIISSYVNLSYYLSYICLHTRCWAVIRYHPITLSYNKYVIDKV